MYSCHVTGSRPESSEGDNCQYDHHHQQQHHHLHHHQGPLLDPMAISMIPAEFESFGGASGLPQSQSRIRELQQQLKMSGLNTDDSGLPQGSLV